MVKLVRDGLATAHTEHMIGGSRATIEVARLRITDAGRRLLTGGK
jgi:hypothetical protein